MMFEELEHMIPMKSLDPHLSLLIIASLLRDDAPWLYELGLDAYRASRDGRRSLARESLRRFRDVLEFTMHHPMMREMFMGSKEDHMLLRNFEHALERAIEFYREEDGMETEPNELGAGG